MYKFTFNGLNFNCNLDDESIVNSLIATFGKDIQSIIDNKDEYIVVTDSDRLTYLEDDSATLWYDIMTKSNIIIQHEKEIADMWYEFMTYKNSKGSDDNV